MIILPTELWNRIFDCLEKQDITECLMVCKLWNQALGKPISISLESDQFQRLLDDMKQCSCLGSKVEHLTVKSHGNGELSSILRLILHQCPNLSRLEFTNLDIQKYIEMLNSAEIQTLPSIQQIHVVCRGMMPHSRNKELLNSIEYKFKNTLTKLDIVNLQDTTPWDIYGGLMTFISSFPHLTSISIDNTWGDNAHPYLELINLFQINANLESLTITRVNLIGLDFSCLPVYPSLKNLRLFRLEADIAFLAFISSKFSNLQELCIDNTNFAQNGSISDKEAARIIEQALSLLSVKKLQLSFNYAGNSYEKNPLQPVITSVVPLVRELHELTDEELRHLVEEEEILDEELRQLVGEEEMMDELVFNETLFRLHE